MGEVANIDARMQAALARLTDNEKECLRRRLRQQTAKEMALDLGVSPHAVEKRLKMARAKLGLSSSLEAARLLVAAEAYQYAGPQPSDLARPAHKAYVRSHLFIMGAISMILIAATVLAIATQTPHASTPSGQLRVVSASEMDWVQAPPDEIRNWLTMNFVLQDSDNSGFIEPAEIPDGLGTFDTPSIRDGKQVVRSATEIEEGRRRWIAEVDTDNDGRVGQEEYLAWRYPHQARLGVPRNWRTWERRSAD